MLLTACRTSVTTFPARSFSRSAIERLIDVSTWIHSPAAPSARRSSASSVLVNASIPVIGGGSGPKIASRPGMRAADRTREAGTLGPVREEMTAAEANRRFYAVAAPTYNATEECVVHRHLTQRLRAALEDAVARLPPSPRALDACGGSGNASLILHD